MSYSLKAGGISVGVKRDIDGANIPPDPRNKDWQEFLEWQKAGNQPKPYVPPAKDIKEENTRLSKEAERLEAIESFKKSKDPKDLALVKAMGW